MIKYTDEAAAKLNNDTPANQLVQLGENIKEIQSSIGGVAVETSGVTVKPTVAIQYEITADASSGVNLYTASVPFDMTIVSVKVEARATSAGGTVTVSDGTNAITDAIIMAADTVTTVDGTIDDAYSTLAAGDTLTLTTNGADDRGLVTILALVG